MCTQLASSFSGRRRTVRLLAGGMVLALLLSGFAPNLAASSLALAPASPGNGHWVGGFHSPGVTHGVNDLVRAPDGSLYVGGDFTAAGDVAANYVARWDGAAWHALGSGMNRFLYALAVGPEGSLYAGGLFTTAGGIPSSYVARWTGGVEHAMTFLPLLLR